MDELASAIAESLLIDCAAGPLEKRLSSRHGGTRSTRRFRSNAEGIFRLGGVEGLVFWLEARVESGIGSDEEMAEIARTQKNISHHISRAKGRLIREWKQDQQRHDYEMVWVELLNQRDLKKRAAEFKFSPDPREAILKRLQAAGVVA